MNEVDEFLSQQHNSLI